MVLASLLIIAVVLQLVATYENRRLANDLEREAVVDERLRFYGIAGLRIADASVMPTITSGNTNTPTAMIAEKAAAMMLEDAR